MILEMKEICCNNFMKVGKQVTMIVSTRSMVRKPITSVLVIQALEMDWLMIEAALILLA
jgi:hypothetical protein